MNEFVFGPNTSTVPQHQCAVDSVSGIATYDPACLYHTLCDQFSSHFVTSGIIILIFIFLAMHLKEFYINHLYAVIIKKNPRFLIIFGDQQYYVNRLKFGEFFMANLILLPISYILLVIVLSSSLDVAGMWGFLKLILPFYIGYEILRYLNNKYRDKIHKLFK